MIMLLVSRAQEDVRSLAGDTVGIADGEEDALVDRRKAELSAVALEITAVTTRAMAIILTAICKTESLSKRTARTPTEVAMIRDLPTGPSNSNLHSKISSSTINLNR